MRLMKLVILGCAVLVLGVAPVHADLSPILVAVAPSAGGFLWTYLVDVSAAQNMLTAGTIPTPGVNPEDEDSGAVNDQKDYVTIYDFAGFTGTVVTDPTVGFVSYLVGSTPADTLPSDLATLPNVTFYRNMLDLTGPISFFVGIESSFGAASQTIVSYAGEGTNKFTGTGESNVGEVLGPAARAVPEPATLLLLGAGLSAVAIRMARRRR